MGDEMAAQYCDGINNPANNKFVALFSKTYHTHPGYYAEAAYVHAELAVAALKSLHGNATNPTALAHALKTTAIAAPRGPVRLNATVDAPTQNIYICKVEKVNGTMEDVPIKTYANVLPWATLPYQTWVSEYTANSVAPPGP
jgi:branched-chain amino acid transport system substrate-binding protein